MPDTHRPSQRSEGPTPPSSGLPRLSRRSVLTGIAVAAGAAGVGIAATTAGANPTAGRAGGTARPLADPDLGPNVHIVGPDTPTADIQAVLDGIFDQT